jgi:RNA polymerase sigma-70 factor (ECF subfamily)
MARTDATRVRFESQVLPHLDAAYRFARWLGNSASDAQDIVQEAMLRAYRGFEGLRGNDVKAWLLTIVRNCHATAYQQQQRRGLVALPERDDAVDLNAMVAAPPDPERLAMAQDEERTLDRLLAHLSLEHREVLMLREIDEMSYREIAAITGVPIGTVMSRLARARGVLKNHWLKEVQGEAHGLP